MEGFDKFQHGILEVAKSHLLPSLEGEQKTAFGKAIKNHLLNIDGPTEVKSEYTEREMYFSKLFYNFTEIAGSLETLEDIAVFISRFPFRGTRVTKERYLQFHLECHLAEIFILRERLKSYLTLLERQHKGDVRLDGIKNLGKVLRKTIENTLKDVVRTRDSHVHEVRFKHKDFDRLRGIGLLARSGEDDLAKTMQVFYQIEYSEIRKRWKTQIIENNKAIRKLLDMFFDTLYAVVFDVNDALNYPARLKP